MKRLESDAYDDDDVRTALEAALERDHRNEVPANLLKAIGDQVTNRQTSLNGHEDVLDRLQRLKVVTECQPLGSTLLDHACVALHQGKFGDEVLRGAVAGAHRDRLQSVERQIQEHCLHDTSKKARRVIDRLPKALTALDVRNLGRRWISSEKPSKSRSLGRRTGLDDGVPLP